MTDQIVVPEPREIANPATGELLSKDDPAGCAVALHEIREMEWRLKEVKRWLTDALVEESARQGSKTLRFDGGIEAVLSTSATVEWDTSELLKLLDAGLPEARYDALVKQEIAFKVNANEAKRIGGTNPKYQEIIERAKTLHERPVSAKVTT